MSTSEHVNAHAHMHTHTHIPDECGHNLTDLQSLVKKTRLWPRFLVQQSLTSYNVLRVSDVTE